MSRDDHRDQHKQADHDLPERHKKAEERVDRQRLGCVHDATLSRFPFSVCVRAAQAGMDVDLRSPCQVP
ncbi:hypothetical protein Acsp01_18300 [Actinoplanes sp. NBRC 101535]|nr:hypothetical protein Acsp01_18300 [Actinoplanes sp. NBRC 101535]